MSFLVHVLLEDLQPESFSRPPCSNQDPRHATLGCVGGIMKLIYQTTSNNLRLRMVMKVMMVMMVRMMMDVGASKESVCFQS